MINVVSECELPIQCEDDVVLVRRKVRQLAQSRRLDSFAVAAITTASSELTRNALVHGKGGKATIAEMSDGQRYGIRVVFTDRGPGIADVARAMSGGYSTSRTMGLGLSGSKRLVDRFELETKVGEGTTVRVEKWQTS